MSCPTCGDVCNQVFKPENKITSLSAYIEHANKRIKELELLLKRTRAFIPTGFIALGVDVDKALEK